MTDTATKVTTWTIDPAHSFAEFSVKHMKVAKVKGRFSDIAGHITIDGDDIEQSRVVVGIGAASIDTRNGMRDAHLRSADFFEVETYPAIAFRSTLVRKDGHALAVTGDLTIHGVTREVTLATECNGQGIRPDGVPIVSFSAATWLNRKDFGLNWNSTLETGGVLVGEDVRIDIDIEAHA